MVPKRAFYAAPRSTMLLAFRRRCRCWCRLQTTLAGEGTPTSTAGVIVSDGLWPAPYDVIQWTGPHAVEFCTALATRTKQNPFVRRDESVPLDVALAAHAT